MKVANLIASIILLIGGINWFLIGLFRYDLVSAVFGSQAALWSRIIFILVGISAIYLLISGIVNTFIDFPGRKVSHR